jgi:hypothetical protein
MVHSQYHHFPSRAREGAKAVVMPAGDRDHIGCFADQVKLTRALVRDLDEAMKEVKLLGEHEEKSSQKITGLEALCKRLREDAQKLKEEDEDDDDEGNAASPPAPTPPAAALEEIVEEEAPMEMVPEQEAPVAHEVILVDAESEPPQPRLFNMIMRDYEESPPRMENGPHELDDLDNLDDLTEPCSDMDE